MDSLKNTMIIVPAYNEEDNLEIAINLINKQKYPGKIIVVNDGSTDKTKEVAERLLKEKKIQELITYKDNKGKAHAFFKRLESTLKNDKLNAIACIDADTQAIGSKLIASLLNHAIEANKAGEEKMFIAPYYEDANHQNTFYSGNRSFTIKAIKNILKYKNSTHIQGFKLESFLNLYFAKKEYKQITQAKMNAFIQKIQIKNEGLFKVKVKPDKLKAYSDVNKFAQNRKSADKRIKLQKSIDGLSARKNRLKKSNIRFTRRRVL